MMDFLNKYQYYVVPISLLLIVLLNILYVNTGFRYMATYNFIAKKYYRLCSYINFFEEHDKLSFGRIILAVLIVLLVRWLWVFKDPGVMFFSLIIFFGGYVFFNKPIVFSTMSDKIKSIFNKVKNTDAGTLEGGESPDDPEDV